MRSTDLLGCEGCQRLKSQENWQHVTLGCFTLGAEYFQKKASQTKVSTCWWALILHNALLSLVQNTFLNSHPHSFPDQPQVNFHCKPEESFPALPRQRSIWEGFPRGAAVKHLPANAGDASSTPGLGRSPPWKRKWQPIPVFLPEESDGQRSLEDYSPWSGKSWTWLSDRACKHMPTPSGAVLPKPLATRRQHTPKGSILPRGEGGTLHPLSSLHSSTVSWRTRSMLQSTLKRGHPPWSPEETDKLPMSKTNGKKSTLS